MEVSKDQTLAASRPNFAADLTRFALASIATGLVTAVAAGAVVMLLA
jgi:hypothetical protein